LKPLKCIFCHFTRQLLVTSGFHLFSNLWSAYNTSLIELIYAAAAVALTHWIWFIWIYLVFHNFCVLRLDFYIVLYFLYFFPFVFGACGFVGFRYQFQSQEENSNRTTYYICRPSNVRAAFGQSAKYYLRYTYRRGEKYGSSYWDRIDKNLINLKRTKGTQLVRLQMKNKFLWKTFKIN